MPRWAEFRLSGFAPDIPADALPTDYWSAVYNTFPQDGIQKRSIGDMDRADAGTAITRYEWFNPIRSYTAGIEGVVYAGNDVAGPRSRVGVYLPGAGHTDVTPAGWAATPTTFNNFYTGGELAGGVLVNDSVHAPVWVDAQALTATILGAALRFTSVRPYKYHAVGIGDRAVAASAGLNTVRWSASAVPGAAPLTWAPAAGNDAGSFDVTAVGEGVLIDGGRLGEDFIIYAENSSHLMTYVGGQTIMASRRLSADTGILARNCWADIGGAHVVVTRDDVVLVNQSGVVRSIADGRVRRAIFEAYQLVGRLYNADGRQLGVQVWQDRRRNQVWIATPLADPSRFLGRAFIYDVATDSWGMRELDLLEPDSYAFGAMCNLELAQPGRGQPRLVVASLGGGLSLGASQLFYAESNNVTPTDQTPSLHQRDGLDLGDASRRKLITGIRIRGHTDGAAVTLRVAIGTKDAADAAYVYSSYIDYVLPTAQRADVLVTGRWVSVIITCVALSPSYRIHGFDLEYQVRGPH